jgi:hypothetical protein
MEKVLGNPWKIRLQMINLPSNLIAIIANMWDIGQASAINLMGTNVETVGSSVLK